MVSMVRNMRTLRHHPIHTLHSIIIDHYVHVCEQYADHDCRMKLKKLSQEESLLHVDPAGLRFNPQQEAEWLRHKHMGLAHEDASMPQKPLGGIRGGDRLARPGKEDSDEDEKFWIQMLDPRDQAAEQERMLKGGHGVPLSGERLIPSGSGAHADII